MVELGFAQAVRLAEQEQQVGQLALAGRGARGALVEQLSEYGSRLLRSRGAAPVLVGVHPPVRYLEGQLPRARLVGCAHRAVGGRDCEGRPALNQSLSPCRDDLLRPEPVGGHEHAEFSPPTR